MSPSRSAHSLRPLLLDAAQAHRAGWVRYDESARATVSCEALKAACGEAELSFSPRHQFPLVRATLDDLNKAVSAQANSPRMEGGKTLRQLYDDELARYEALSAAAQAEGALEPGYGTYVVDHAHGDLYLVAPERWHRLALVTSNSKLLTDPQERLSWAQVRETLERAVVGFAGLSVGGNLLEGFLREARPRRVKLADPDWVEVTNFNRGERMSLRHAVQSRGARFDPRNPYDVPRVSKAEYAAYEAQLVDPYLEAYVYKEGLTRETLGSFFDGGDGEPPIDLLVEEMDNPDLKLLVREEARKRRIDVLMLTDMGHKVHVLWNGFKDRPDAPLGFGAKDEELLAAAAATKTGDRSSIFRFVDALCGSGLAEDQFLTWKEARGEQPTASLPQSGATAMASGAVGGKELAARLLGYPFPKTGRAVYDLLHRTATA